MDFEWDSLKERINFRKHGVWFDEAKTIWADTRSLEFYDDDHSSKEERFIRIGFSIRHRLLLVVYCEKDDGETVRIISARKATSRERNFYEERI
ncbi:BrnT family toxin [Bdellovibrio sp. KM01]|uniref:BrnT family toxin n=1 Tax=Bdellovibrio sp. KM01 TaxID=2748865 RepID=UPI0015EB0917|nr:BrnT family toxin [Bdellovibrio sp. KM01]QLY24229.1 BrnT family toxin [Bdellovibrio sp. KM01]